MTTASQPQLLQTALAHHRAGRLQQAEAIYRQILAANPKDADALHKLGVLALDLGKMDVAVDLIGRAIQVNPNRWDYCSDLGLALLKQGRNQQAITAYKRSLEMNPSNLAAYHNLASALHGLGQIDEAIAFYVQAMRCDPDNAETYLNLAKALRAYGRLDETIEAYRRFAKLKPDSPDADYNLGNALVEANQDTEAVEYLARALRHHPKDPLVHTNLGIALESVGRTAEAIQAHATAISLEPNVATYYYNLGISLQRFLRFPEAVEAFAKAVELDPNEADFRNNLGGALRSVGRLDDAIECYRKTSELRPGSPMGLNNLGNAAKDIGQLDDAINYYDQALALEPECTFHHSNRVYVMYFHPRFSAQEILAEHRRWNEIHARPLANSFHSHQNTPEPERRLRIGYVSSDFREHVVGQNMFPLLANHDRENFEIFCYATVDNPDALTRQFQGIAHSWRNLRGITDEKTARIIHRDRIDILVDLSLHMSGNRLLVFARKPAPIQVTFAGYPGGTGMDAIDYRLSDVYLDPPEFDAHYVEKTIRLPDSFWCYDPVAMGVARGFPLNPPPASKNGFVTFGSLNNFCKVNDGVIALWSKVLAGVENSRLSLISPQGSTRKRLADQFSREGIDPSRVKFLDRQDHDLYFKLYYDIDISLDTLPYNGHTTNLDSLWMGVPFVTMLGKTIVGRAGWSQLSNLKCTELAAKTPEEFVRIAVNLAKDLPRLTDLRATLRQRILESPLCDTKKFARSIEAAYRLMWREWCAQARP
jgi:predicted O-linked N-acetylglucosamine transferase (SPINDLY family)